ncbi:MAG: diguanylate cyclase domain-containing protein [Ignavibacteria bacterium]
MRSIRFVLGAIVVVVNVFVCALLLYGLDADREQLEREVATNVENLALLLDQTVAASADRIDLALRDISEELTDHLARRGKLDDREVNELLASWQQKLSPVIGLRVSDASGRVRYGKGVTSAAYVSYADREFFAVHRDKPGAGLAVSNPVVGRLSNERVIPFTRRYESPDGGFAGVIAAAVPVSYFERLLSGLDLGPHGVALLRDADTALIVRHPADSDPAQQPGAKTFSKELAEIIASGATAKTYHTARTADGIERMNTYRRLSAVPFHLVAGRATDDYLAEWRRAVVKDATLASLFLIVTTGLAWLLWRSIALGERANARSRILLQHASDGIHILDTDGRLIEASDSFCRMLGYTRAEALGMDVSRWDAKLPREKIVRDLAEWTSAGHVATLETVHRRKDGSTFDVEITTYPVDLGGQMVVFASSRDISERKRADEERRIAAVAFESRHGMVVTDAASNIVRVNRTFTELTGFEPHEVVGRTPKMLKSGRHDQAFYREMWRAIQQDGCWQGEIWNRRKNGEIYPEWLTITAVRDAQQAITHYVASFWDISRRIEDEMEIRNLAFFDPLTGLANRRLLSDRLQHAFAKSSRSSNWGAVLFIDLDHFKDLNDQLGHASGDKLLELAADRLRVNVREGDTVARFGGDEFVVLLEDLDPAREGAAAKAQAIAEKLCTALAVPYRIGAARAEEWRCTASVGSALFQGSEADVDQVLARADRALYVAKGGGRNRVYLG